MSVPAVNMALTTKGLALNAKIQAGEGTVPLNITRIMSASGTSDDPLNLTAGVDEQQQYTIQNVAVSDDRAIILALLTNLGNPYLMPPEPPLAVGYPLSQILFYATDPDEGEILYRISQFPNPIPIPSASESTMTLNPTFDISTSNASEVFLYVDPAGLVTYASLIAELKPFENRLTEHIGHNVDGSIGVHGIRYFNEALQIWDGAQWNDVEINVIPQLTAPMNLTITRGNAQLVLNWINSTAPSFAGVRVVYKTGSYPTSPTDGTYVDVPGTPGSAGTSTITGLTNGTTYYFALYSYSSVPTFSSPAQSSAAPVSITTPSQTGTLTYTGGSQNPTWNNYDSSQLTLGGVTSSVNAGTFTATFTPAAGYQWSDGTAAPRNVNWTINRAAGSLSLNPTSVTLNPTTPNGTINVTRAGDGAITAQSSNTSVATVSVSGTTVTVNNVGQTSGNATIAVSVAQGTNHTAPANQNASVTAAFLPSHSTTFSANTWSQIAGVSDYISANNLTPQQVNTTFGWSIGDTKDISVNSPAETVTMQIYDFNHDDKTGGGKAGITLGMRHLMAATRAMNASNTNVGGYTGSAMYSWLVNTLYPTLPSDLRTVIKQVNKKTSAGNQSTVINTDAMNIFLFSEIECFGATTYSVAGEGAAYPIFTDNASRIKNQSNGSGTANNWWERSPIAANATNFCNVGSNGSANVTNASYAWGVCFGFCI